MAGSSPRPSSETAQESLEGLQKQVGAMGAPSFNGKPKISGGAASLEFWVALWQGKVHDGMKSKAMAEMDVPVDG